MNLKRERESSVRSVTADFAYTQSVDEDFIDGNIAIFCNRKEDYDLIKNFVSHQIEIAKQDNSDKDKLAYTE